MDTQLIGLRNYGRGPGVTLRPVREDDVEFLWHLRQATMREQIDGTIGWQDSVQRACVLELIPAGRIIVVDGEDVGVLATRDFREFDLAELYVKFIAILPHMQGRGLGAAVLRSFQNEATHAGCNVSLRVVVTSRARRLYERLGFAEYQADGFMIFMRWKCPAHGGLTLLE